MTGTEHVPRSGGALLAFNHVSYVDFVYGGLAAHPSKRLVRFMAKRELFDHRWTGPLMRSLHHIEVDRADGVGSFRTAVDYLRAGEVVGIFPEADDLARHGAQGAQDRRRPDRGRGRGAARAGRAVGNPAADDEGPSARLLAGHSRSGSPWVRPLQPTGADPVAETAELKAAMAGLLDTAIASYADAHLLSRRLVGPGVEGRLGSEPGRAEVLDVEEKRSRARRRSAGG